MAEKTKPTTESVEEKVPFYVRKQLKDRQKDGTIDENDSVVSYSTDGSLVTVITETASFAFEKE